MRTYTMMVYIPESMSPPAGGGPFTITNAQRIRAINAASRLPQRLVDASNGMATVDLTIRSVPQTLGSTYYLNVPSGEYAGDYPSAGAIAQLYGESASYDFWDVLTPYSMIPGAVIPGLSFVNTTWASCSEPRLTQILLHELLHLIGYHVEVTHGITTGWPECDANDGVTQGLHCAIDYGFPTTIEPEWLDQYARGTVGGSLGFTADKWEVETPMEEGLRSTPKPERLTTSKWGTVGNIRVPVPV
jgi:hypothetical protein